MAAAAKILLVDDDAGVRFFIHEILARDGHQVVAVESGEAALERAAAQEFDVALVDLKLRGLGGAELLTALRQRSSDMVIIVLTGHASLETAIEALRQGAHDYLFKPCSVTDLRESVRTGLLKQKMKQRREVLLDRLAQHLTDGEPNGHGASADAVQGLVATSTEIIAEALKPPSRLPQPGSLIVDTARHAITLEGRRLELSPTEFAMLAYLAGEAPRVISAQELLRVVRGYESEPWEASEALRYHIHRIRRKINQVTGHADVIRTVRGIGYTIEPQFSSKS